MNTYHKRFLETFSAENVIGLFSRYRGAAKEITESWGMLEAAKKYVPNLNESSVIVVGDGCSPRTGALFAYYTKANVISVDPNFNMDHWIDHQEKQTSIGFAPQRLHVFKEKIEDKLWHIYSETVVVVWPHSHANMNAARLTGKYSKRIDIAMPCCVPIPKAWMVKPHIVFDDYHILSPKRTIHVWGGGC